MASQRQVGPRSVRVSPPAALLAIGAATSDKVSYVCALAAVRTRPRHPAVDSASRRAQMGARSAVPHQEPSGQSVVVVSDLLDKLLACASFVRIGCELLCGSCPSAGGPPPGFAWSRSNDDRAADTASPRTNRHRGEYERDIVGETCWRTRDGSETPAGDDDDRPPITEGPGETRSNAVNPSMIRRSKRYAPIDASTRLAPVP
jgi:hypothetical protein